MITRKKFLPVITVCDHARDHAVITRLFLLGGGGFFNGGEPIVFVTLNYLPKFNDCITHLGLNSTFELCRQMLQQ